MAQHNEFGKWGEDIAVAHLVNQGYRILERNWTINHKEVDIIATNGSVLLFVEVKARRTCLYGNPYEAVNFRKRQYLLSAMRSYLAIHNLNMAVRFDIVSITGSPAYYTIEQLENAVSDLSYSPS